MILLLTLLACGGTEKHDTSAAEPEDTSTGVSTSTSTSSTSDPGRGEALRDPDLAEDLEDAPGESAQSLAPDLARALRLSRRPQLRQPAPGKSLEARASAQFAGATT